MCGIAGFFHKSEPYNRMREYWLSILNNMAESIRHRGPDEGGVYLEDGIGLAHRRLSIIDLVSGGQPMEAVKDGRNYVIVYNGECYNTMELKQDLIKQGYSFCTTSDTEIMLASYIIYGEQFIERVNGIFACAIWDKAEEKLFLYRDRAGVKPLFYTVLKNGTFIFGSELKALFLFPGVEAVLDRNGLNEVFTLGPAKTYGSGVFRNVKEVLPGNYLVCDGKTVTEKVYWKLESVPHTDSYEETIQKTMYLVRDSIRRQMVSDVSICTFLSGGVDSSIVTAVCAKELLKKGEQLNTFSFDFVGHDKYFKSNSFQPSQDRPYVDICVNALNTNHRYLECENCTLADDLYKAVDARDLPNMADVESSLLYFCKEVKKYYKVALTGECADEIFGGYPWFSDPEAFENHCFPWAKDLSPRKAMLKDEFVEFLGMEDYASNAYERTIKETPKLEGESRDEARRREITFLNQKWFMQTLLDRMDRTSSFCGLEARVPIADHRIMQYVFNVPWEMKCKNGLKKSLLRAAGKGILPDEVLYRRKSPYPKTYDPAYEKILADRLREVVENSSSPVNQFLDKKKVEQFIQSPKDYGRPWYGQLMAGPQLMAYTLQINYWMEKYKIRVEE